MCGGENRAEEKGLSRCIGRVEVHERHSLKTIWNVIHWRKLKLHDDTYLPDLKFIVIFLRNPDVLVLFDGEQPNTNLANPPVSGIITTIPGLNLTLLQY